MTDNSPFDAAAINLTEARSIATASAIELADTILILHAAGVLELDADEGSVRDFEQMIADHREVRARWSAASDAVLGALHT